MKLNLTKEKRRYLLCLPIVAIPFCCLVFHVLGGGGGGGQRGAVPKGLNTQLPAATVDLRKAFQDKLKTYEQADKDSLRQEQWQRQDPYRKDSIGSKGQRVVVGRTILGEDPRATQLEQRLARLQQSLHSTQPATSRLAPTIVPRQELHVVANTEPHVTAARPDPQLDRLNAMLDKVIRIQHPQEQVSGIPAAAAGLPLTRQAEEVMPADSGMNSIAAVIPADQTLVAGGTIALRITDSIRVGNRVLPAGELVYGTVTINNDRLLVHIGALREDRNLFVTDWQVYDLDGLAGMHIPGVLSRDVAKQSVDQGVNSLNLVTLDQGLGAQMAGAGIQAAKSFLGRKVRQVRVTVRSGYQVLLRSPRSADVRRREVARPVESKDSKAKPPEWMAEGKPLEHCRNEGMELRLCIICIHDSGLWFGLEWRNRSPIPYTPAYARWTIRDRRVFRRTAQQEQGLEPMVSAPLPTVGGDSVEHGFTGFRPFALARDKQLVLEVGEKGGGRTLQLVISHKDILKAIDYAKASQ